MHDAVYPNHCAPAQTADSLKVARQAAAEKPIQVMPNNSLNLLPEHLNDICFKWIGHMAKQRMPPNCMRILNAIFNQTLSFKKRQDDMAGTRLQQLTYIRADHANHAVRVLEKEHAVITYKGRYGKWLSINFAFESWGKKKKIKQRNYNNDPQCLLPDYYTEEPVDAALSMGYDDDGEDESLDLGASINTAIVQQTTTNTATESHKENSFTSNRDTESNTEISNADHTSQVSENMALNEKILEKLQQFEDKIQGIEQQLNHAQTHTHEIINQAISEHQKTFTTQEQTGLDTDNDNNNHTQPAVNNSTQQSSSTERNTHSNHNNNAQTIENNLPQGQSSTDSSNNNNTQITENSAINSQSPTQTTQQNPASENETTVQKTTVQNLQYPVTIDTPLQQRLGEILTPTGDDAQDVLNLLAKRMQNTHNPIVSPSAYLNDLVQRYQTGTLDFSANIATATPQPAQAPQLSEKEAYIQQVKKTYQDAYADYQHIKRNMDMLRDHENETFEEYVQSQSLAMQKLWYKIQMTLSDAYDELEAAMNEQENAVKK